jgi:hypothetical protein
MERREMLKNAGGAFAATAVGMSGLSEVVAGDNPRVESVKILTTSSNPIVIKQPYDPVAVLEAIPEWFLICLERTPEADADRKWWASIMDDRIDGSFEEQDYFPDFPAAVRWLHRQAAAVDAEFAKAWPVPEDA